MEIQFKPFTGTDWSCWSAAEAFLTGEEPVIWEHTEKEPFVMVVLDKNGVYISIFDDNGHYVAGYFLEMNFATLTQATTFFQQLELDVNSITNFKILESIGFSCVF